MLSTILKYPILILLSIGKKNFQNLGRIINRSGDTVSRMLCEASTSIETTHNIGTIVFRKKKRLFLTIDDTLVRKIYSRFMQGSGRFYDTALRQRINAYRIVIGMISDGKMGIPIDCAYLFSKELLDLLREKYPTKDELTQRFIRLAFKLFPDARIIILADGLYATVDMLRWLKEGKIAAEMRMHSNRKVFYGGEMITLKTLAQRSSIVLRGRRMARTITAVWHGLELEITIVRRTDKHGDESIVFQVATYKATPSQHVANYKKRWGIEKLNRTTKQSLGLQDCYSTDMGKQHSHIAAVLLAYALAQIHMKFKKFKTPEDAIRDLKMKNFYILIDKFVDLIRSLEFYA